MWSKGFLLLRDAVSPHEKKRSLTIVAVLMAIFPVNILRGDAEAVHT